MYQFSTGSTDLFVSTVSMCISLAQAVQICQYSKYGYQFSTVSTALFVSTVNIGFSLAQPAASTALFVSIVSMGVSSAHAVQIYLSV